MISKEELSKLLTTKLGKSTTVTEITTAGSGFHSDGYKVTTDNGECYFLKKVKSEDMGYEFPERKLMSLLVSHSMLLSGVLTGLGCIPFAPALCAILSYDI